MKNIHEQKLKVLSSQTDMNIQMGLFQALAIAQDNMCEFFRDIGCDGMNMIPKCNCFFVMLKSKIHFDDFVNWLDKYSVRTDLVNKSKLRVDVETEFLDSDGNRFAVCTQELCAMDNTSRTLRSLDTTALPEDIELSKVQTLVFDKMTFDLADNEPDKIHVVDLMNIDLYKHTNNLEYIRFMLSMLDMDFAINNTITDFEVHYICESRYGDKLKLYKCVEPGRILFEIVRDEKVITKAILNYIPLKHKSLW